MVETRNAATILRGAHPVLFDELAKILEEFSFDVERIVRGGGSKHLIPLELDEAFRAIGWREASFEQELTTVLVIQPYGAAGERGTKRVAPVNEYKGHKIDNVKGRIGLDVEWNPKDGNLDRDFGNFRALYDAGVLDLGVIITRRETGMRDLWRTTIERAKALDARAPTSPAWTERLKKTPNDPLGTSTTSNFEKLVPRIERGDGGGCPILAIAITTNCGVVPEDIDSEIRRVALAHSLERRPVRLAQRMGLVTMPKET
jgi:hypothetical protein